MNIGKPVNKKIRNFLWYSVRSSYLSVNDSVWLSVHDLENSVWMSVELPTSNIRNETR
jgi:hypothetical protein